MISVADTTSVASWYGACIRSFEQLCNLLQTLDGEFSTQISLPALKDEFGRFRAWAGNVGAHRDGRTSLDHRLREASQIHKQVMELLSDLDKTLQETIAIVSHERQPSDELSWSSDSSVSSLADGSEAEFEDGMDSTTELQERFLEINQVISCLYRFSIAIRNPTPRDRLQKYAAIEVSHYEFFDIQHTSHRFPKAEKYLIDRLGKANSRRRQLLKYHEKHHKKLAQYINLPPTRPWDTPEVSRPNHSEATNSGRGFLDENYQDLQDRPDPRKGPATITTTINTQTTISTYVGPSNIIAVRSDDGQSQTSYATSVTVDTASKLRVPPPKHDSTFDGKPFECPYCFSITILRDSRSWMKHVFRDLRPYVCTFRDCLKPDHLFESCHDWYNHELEVHRREWFCNACHQPFSRKALFEDHLRQDHSELFTGAQLPAVADRCERAIDSKSEQACPLCQGTYTTPQLQSHLARHMQQLALFTLPKVVEEKNDGERVGDEGSIGVQASRPDEEETEGSLLSSNLVSDSSQETMNFSNTQSEIPDTQNETWSHLMTTKDLDDEESRLKLGTGRGFNESPYMMLSRAAERLELQTIGNTKSSLGPEHPETMTSLASLASTYWDQDRRVEAEKLQLQVVDVRKKTLGENHPSTLEAVEGLALMYLSRGRWREAERLQLDVMERRRMHLGEDHPDTLAGKTNLASMFRNRGLLTEAEKLGSEALEGRKRIVGSDHPDTLAAIAILASTYRSQRRLREAEDLEVEVLKERTSALDKGHPDILEAMENLALTLRGQGRYTAALNLQTEVADGRKRVMGESHLDTLEAIANKASTLRVRRCLVAAEELEVRVLEGRKGILGEGHPGTLTAMENIALTYQSQGRWLEAETFQTGVVAGRGEILGGDHPKTLEAIANLASTYMKQGQWDKAEEHQVAVMNARRRVLGQGHPDTLGAIANLASIYRGQKRWKKAEELEVQVMIDRERTLGKEHAETLAAMGALASTYRRQARLDKSEELEVEIDERKRAISEDYPNNLAEVTTQKLIDQKQEPWTTQAEADELEDLAIDARRRVLGEGHPDTIAAMANKVLTCWKQGRWMEAGDLKMHAMSMGKGVLDSDQSAIVAIRELASTYHKEGLWTEVEAEELQQLTVAARRRVLGGGHPDTLASIANLASTYGKQGRWVEAEKVQVEVVAQRKRHLGGGHHDTLTAIASLASIYRKQGRWIEAENLQVEVVAQRRIVFGEDHPDTLKAVRNLESMYQHQGHLREFEEFEEFEDYEKDEEDT